jgi:hypothetical protein
LHELPLDVGVDGFGFGGAVESAYRGEEDADHARKRGPNGQSERGAVSGRRCEGPDEAARRAEWTVGEKVHGSGLVVSASVERAFQATEGAAVDLNRTCVADAVLQPKAHSGMELGPLELQALERLGVDDGHAEGPACVRTDLPKSDFLAGDFAVEP